jgi:phage-related protein
VKELTPITQAHKNQLDSEWPFIWMYEIQADDGDPPEMYRLTNYTERQTFNQNVYYPAPITHSGINLGSDGDLPTLDFAIANASLEVAPLVDQGDGLVGKFVRISIVSLLDIANLDAPMAHEGVIVGSSMDGEKTNVSVGAFNYFTASFPPFAYSRRKCRWLFGTGECGYDTEVTDAGFKGCGITSAAHALGADVVLAAPFTLEACDLVGDDEEDNIANVPAGKQHPQRFGGVPATPPPRRF